MIGLWSAVSGFLAGAIAAMGLGGGSMLIIFLTVFQNTPQQLAQGINLVFFIPIAVVAIIYHTIKKLVDWKFAMIFTILGILGAVIGSFLSSYIDANILRKIFGIFLLVVGGSQFFKN